MIMLEDGQFVAILMAMMVNIILLHWIQLLMAVLLSNALVRTLIEHQIAPIAPVTEDIAMDHMRTPPLTNVIKTLGQIIAPLMVAMEQV